MIHRFQMPDGRITEVWGFSSLNIELETIGRGTVVRIIYKGKEKDKKGNLVHAIEVYTATLPATGFDGDESDELPF